MRRGEAADRQNLTSNGGPKTMLRRKQEDAIAALLTQRNIEEAAKAAGISARTLLRWLKLAEFHLGGHFKTGQ